MRLERRLISDFVLYGAVAIAFAGVALAVMAPILYKQCLQRHRDNLMIATREIHNLAHIYLVEIQNTATYVGHEVVRSGGDDITAIAEHLKVAEQGHQQHNALYSYTLLDWVTADARMIANSRVGIMEQPMPVRDRAYTVECPSAPWKMVLCAPTWGMTSGAWVVPFGMGVTSPQGKFLGIITGGVNIQALKRKIQQHLQDPFTNFLICDKDLRVICHSLDAEDADLSKVSRILFGAFDCKNKEQGTLKQPVTAEATDFYSYQKVDDFPLYIFAGLPPKALNREFKNLFFFHAMEIFFLTLFFLCLLYFFSRASMRLRHAKALLKLEIDTLKSSLSAEEIYLEKLNCEALLHVDEAKKLTSVLLKHLKGALDFPLSLEQQIEALRSIGEQIKHLARGTVGALQMAQVRFPKIVEECLRIHAKEAFAKQIGLSSSIPQEVSGAYPGDELRLTQILASLLYKAIECTPQGGKVHVELSQVVKEGMPAVQIAVKHSGFHLTEEDLSRLDSHFSQSTPPYLGPLALDLSSIQKLVHLHGGVLETRSKWGDWTAFIVTLIVKNGKTEY